MYCFAKQQEEVAGKVKVKKEAGCRTLAVFKGAGFPTRIG